MEVCTFTTENGNAILWANWPAGQHCNHYTSGIISTLLSLQLISMTSFIIYTSVTDGVSSFMSILHTFLLLHLKCCQFRQVTVCHLLPAHKDAIKSWQWCWYPMPVAQILVGISFSKNMINSQTPVFCVCMSGQRSLQLLKLEVHFTKWMLTFLCIKCAIMEPERTVFSECLSPATPHLQSHLMLSLSVQLAQVLCKERER